MFSSCFNSTFHTCDLAPRCHIVFATLLYYHLTLLERVGDGSPRALSAVPCLALLTTGSDDSKPYVFLKTLDESYKNHIIFTTIRASGEEQ